MKLCSSDNHYTTAPFFSIFDSDQYLPTSLHAYNWIVASDTCPIFNFM